MTTPAPAPQSPSPQQYAVPAGEWNVMAIVGFIAVWFISILGLVLGYIGLSQIKRTGQRGHGLALAAVIIGWISIALSILAVVVIVIVFATGIAVSPSLQN